jgi:hypothetical protein
VSGGILKVSSASTSTQKEKQMDHQQSKLTKILAGLQLAAAGAIAIALATVPIASAQTAANTVPNLIRYSGTLPGEQGAAASPPAVVGVTFALYNQQEGGAPIWMETQNVTPEPAGQYSVLLGSTRAEGVPAELFSDQQQRWLGVEIQGQPEQARVLLVSVPYALRAHDAETLGGLPASAFAQISAPRSGIVTIESKTSSSALPVSAAVGPDVLSGTGAAGKIPLWTGTSTLANSSLFESTTGATTSFIGVKTTSPSAQLDVTGAINTSPNTTAGSNTGNYQILEAPVLSLGWPAPISLSNNDLFVGYYAGAQGFVQGAGTGDTGTSDTFVGTEAGFHNQSGSTNTAVGSLAGYRNETGNNNVSIGTDAGFGVLGVSMNNTTVVGESAGANNTASDIAFFGYLAGQNNTGAGNSFIGDQSGVANTSGEFNTFLGFEAGYSNTQGDSNTFLGHLACYNIATGNEDICIGDNVGPPPSGSALSNTIWIGAQGVQATTYIAGIAGAILPTTSEPTVCIDLTTGQLGTTGCIDSLTIDQHARQIKAQAQQIAGLQQRLARLESLLAKQQ